VYKKKKKNELPKNGIVIMMNARGQMLANTRFTNMEEIPVLMEKNLAEEGKIFFIVSIDGKKANTINRFTLIQRDVNTPPDEFQKLLNAVGEVYTSKRNEIARQYYQIDYNALDAIKKSEIDFAVPIMVMIEVKGPFMKTEPEKKYPNVYNSDSPIFIFKEVRKNDAGGFSDEECKAITAEFDKMADHRILYNGQMTKIRDISELLTKDTNNKLMIIYQYHHDPKTKEGMCRIGLSLPSIDPKDPAFCYLVNGKWIYGGKGLNIDQMKSIETYAPADAVKKYGSKAKNGAITIITQ
jgi:hypothetical protein